LTRTFIWVRPIGSHNAIAMLSETLQHPSKHGVWLLLQPALWAIALLLACRVIGDVAHSATPVLRLLAIAAWAIVVAELDRRRTLEVMKWYRRAAVELGGEAEPDQPVDIEGCSGRELPLSRLTQLERDRATFMRAPGALSRRWLAFLGLAVAGGQCLVVAVAEPSASLRGAAAALALAVAVSLALLATGYRLSPTGPPRLRDTRPQAWVVREPRSRFPGPIWLGLLTLFVLALAWVVDAPSAHVGMSRGIGFVPILVALWTLHRWTARVWWLEGTRVHFLCTRLVVALATPVWWLLRAMQAALFAIGLLAMWLGALYASGFALATECFGVWMALRMLLNEWRRPMDPLIINAQELHGVLTDERMETLVTVTLATLCLAIAIPQFLGA
jgi:hypothetical protein